jgi:K+-sensing histidine kinase KdpD
MRSPIRLRLAERAELIALGVTLLATASLVFWWTILLRGEMRNNESLERALLAREQGLTVQQVAERQVAIDAHHDRRNVMLVGESTLLALMLSGSLVVLFLLVPAAQTATRRHGKLLQFTSHEFKTPVAGVKGLLQSLALGSIPEAQRAELIKLGQIECDRLEHWPRLFWLISAPCRASRARALSVSMWRNSSAISSRIAQAPRSAAKSRLRPSTPCTVWETATASACDPRKPLDNANKYGGGSVSIAAEVRDGVWCLGISDHGRGFEPAAAEKLFDLHNRGSGEGITHGAGLGSRSHGNSRAEWAATCLRTARSRPGRSLHGSSSAGAAIDAAGAGRDRAPWLSGSPSSKTSAWCVSSWP